MVDYRPTAKQRSIARAVAVPEHHGPGAGPGHEGRIVRPGRRGPPRTPRPRRETSNRRSKSSRATPTSMRTSSARWSDADFRTEIDMFGNKTTQGRVHREPGAGRVRGLSNPAVRLPQGVWTRRAEHDEPVGGRRSSSGRPASPTRPPRSRFCARAVCAPGCACSRAGRPGGRAGAAAGPPPSRRAVPVPLGDHPTLRVGRPGSGVPGPARNGAAHSTRRLVEALSTPTGAGGASRWRAATSASSTRSPTSSATRSSPNATPSSTCGSPAASSCRAGGSRCRSGAMRSPAAPTSTSSSARCWAASWRPGRDVGVMAHGRLSDRLTYDAGYFTPRRRQRAIAQGTGGGDHAVAGRVELQPFTARKGSAARAAGDRRRRVTRSRARRRRWACGGKRCSATASSSIACSPNGRRLRLGADAEWSRGPFGLTGEFARHLGRAARHGPRRRGPAGHRRDRHGTSRAPGC